MIPKEEEKEVRSPARGKYQEDVAVEGGLGPAEEESSVSEEEICVRSNIKEFLEGLDADQQSYAERLLLAGSQQSAWTPELTGRTRPLIRKMKKHFLMNPQGRLLDKEIINKVMKQRLGGRVA